MTSGCIEDISLSDAEFSELVRGGRIVRAFRALNISELERMVIGALMTDSNPWPILTLEQRISYTRAAIRLVLKDMRLMGLAEEQTRRGWRLTPLGQALFTLIYREALVIADGKRSRFSDRLLDCISRVNDTTARRPFTIPDGNVV